MRSFACAGAACPDTCCRDFGIEVSRPDLDRMLSATARDLVDHARVVRLVVLSAPPPGAAAAASPRISLEEDGACALLENDGQCMIHKKYGEAALSSTCSIFPRTSLAVEDRLEITGTLACPEVARLTLLTADGTVQAESAQSLLPRPYVGKTIDAGHQGPDGYTASFSRVRDTLLHLFGRENFPLGARLIFAAQLAAQVDDFFHRGTEGFTGPGRLFARQRLTAELADAVDDAALRDQHRDLASFGGTCDGVVDAAVALLVERKRLPHAPRYATLLDGALGSLRTEAGGGLDVEQGAPSAPTAAALVEVLARRRERLERRLPGLTDRILGRYCTHFLLRHPYTDAPSLLGYLGRMALSVAAVRLLLLGAPAVTALLDGDADPEADEARFSALAVDIVQIFTKTVSHQVAFLTAFQQANEAGRGITFGRLALFAKFI